MFDRDELVEIPESRRHYFGGAGLMLLPGRPTVELVLRAIPRGRVRATTDIGRELAAAAGARGTCPVTLRRVLGAIAKDDAGDTPWWRVVCSNGVLFASALGGRGEQASRLQAEGIGISGEGKSLRVIG